MEVHTVVTGDDEQIVRNELTFALPSSRSPFIERFPWRIDEESDIIAVKQVRET
jgi:hypothetical protein